MKSDTLSDEQLLALDQRIQSIPIVDTLKMKILKLEKGSCEAMVPRHTQWDGIYETFHGGMLGTIADTVTCWSILTEIGAESLVATTDFNIRFLRPCHTDVVCKAHVVRVGRTMCLAHADLYDTNGKLVAVSQVNYIRLQG
ncbi:MAG: PaaI family thioesterase [Euryarchaeota archaeon]|nr:PaaI family thioesterase [Euryarchaeota archaeon]MBT5025716.1 PaaI family thioesterase [Euryarchaeota archaeon]MBT6255530.1 PaaI family thioesterase [Euryarchaeota archaeon]MBT6526965.1 PaaI family thioesterase [Euryarchaeota archaeon]MBT7961974.1 PaaI family thioesterase [Euryarchaeota archaeon]